MVDNLLRLGTAVVATYDIYAINIINLLKEAGVEVGKDYSVTGFDGIEDAEVCGLTTVEQPVEDLIKNAFRMLDERLEGEAPEKLLIKPKFIIRSSTGKLKSKRSALQ
jgi:LacI family transcriptional regulator